MAEEFALNQLCRHRGAIERDKRAGRARTLLVQRARHQLLARAGFAIDANAGFAGGHALNLRHHAAHGFSCEDQGVLTHAHAQVAILALKPRELECVLNGHKQLLGGERLLEKIKRTKARCADGHFDVRLSAHHHHRCGDAGGLQVFKKEQAVAARHYYVRQDQIEGLGACQLQRTRGIIADHSLVAGEAEGASQRGQRIGFVIDDEDVGFGAHDVLSSARGSVITKVAPLPVSLCTETAPLWSATTDCTMARPSPVPCWRVV